MTLYNNKFEGWDIKSIYTWYNNHGTDWVKIDSGMYIPSKKFIIFKQVSGYRYYQIKKDDLIEAIEIIYSILMKLYILGGCSDLKIINKIDLNYATQHHSKSIILNFREFFIISNEKLIVSPIGIDFINNYDMMITSINEEL